MEPRCALCLKTGLRMSDMRIEGCNSGRRQRVTAPLCVDCAESIRALFPEAPAAAKPEEPRK